jgi:ankyrin repeat protein
MVQMLLSKGPDRNARDNYEKTALDYAKEIGNADIIGLLEVPVSVDEQGGS